MTRKPKPDPSSEAGDLRDLLAAVLEALSLDRDADDYDERIKERTILARVVIREGLAEPAWNADWLRRKLREEEARHEGGEQS
ncbi:hypothetical protein ABT215_11090 [Streptomyces sp900105755]|uniref:hypothetical protein n=1 Tax=Streptomyces sp. 900105755 TaxID=3154389 RepID=UPI003327DAC8